jgi:hypothetical protein
MSALIFIALFAVMVGGFLIVDVLETASAPERSGKRNDLVIGSLLILFGAAVISFCYLQNKLPAMTNAGFNL